MNFKNTKKVIYMKKLIFPIVIVAIFGIATFFLSSCDVKTAEDTCHDSGKFWCSDAKTCCTYAYYDGHGSCWDTMSGCRSTGYACSACHK